MATCKIKSKIFSILDINAIFLIIYNFSTGSSNQINNKDNFINPSNI